MPLAEGAVLAIGGQPSAARGADEIGRLATMLLEDNRMYLAEPRRVVQARDIALVLGDRAINVVRRGSDGAWRYTGPVAQWQGSVVQGALEHANVDAAYETIRLMEVTRHAESVQRAISIYDKAMDTGINHLGNE